MERKDIILRSHENYERSNKGDEAEVSGSKYVRSGKVRGIRILNLEGGY
ncbi:MAG: hypothetical protein QXU18_14455 [Thermoplasmatales archaeon]